VRVERVAAAAARRVEGTKRDLAARLRVPHFNIAVNMPFYNVSLASSLAARRLSAIIMNAESCIVSTLHDMTCTRDLVDLDLEVE